MSFQLGPTEAWLHGLCGRPSLFLLVDPDRSDEAALDRLAEAATAAGVTAFLAGTSLMMRSDLGQKVARLKQLSGLPVLLFPGDAGQVVPEVDAVLFLSLISGRNPQYLIGEQVRAAPLLAAGGIECLPTAYLLVESGTHTSALFMSASSPLPRHKPDIAVAHALAAQALGLRQLYLEAGSGARQPVPEDMIRQVRRAFAGPLFVGGGLRGAEDVSRAAAAGADVVVVGSRLEECRAGEERVLLDELVAAVKQEGRS